MKAVGGIKEPPKNVFEVIRGTQRRLAMVGVLGWSLKDIHNGGHATEVVEGHSGCQKG
jgi:hypothetical protein